MKRFFQFQFLTENPEALQKHGQAGALELKAVLMKRVAYLLLFAYSLMLIKPVMPIFMDVLAHTFWEQQHMLAVHEVNGKFHVHYETLKASGQAGNDKQGTTDKATFGDDLYLTSAIAYQLPKAPFTKKSFPLYTYSYTYVYPILHYPPPRA